MVSLPQACSFESARPSHEDDEAACVNRGSLLAATLTSWLNVATWTLERSRAESAVVVSRAALLNTPVQRSNPQPTGGSIAFPPIKWSWRWRPPWQ